MGTTNFLLTASWMSPEFHRCSPSAQLSLKQMKMLSSPSLLTPFLSTAASSPYCTKCDILSGCDVTNDDACSEHHSLASSPALFPTPLVHDTSKHFSECNTFSTSLCRSLSLPSLEYRHVEDDKCEDESTELNSTSRRRGNGYSQHDDSILKRKHQLQVPSDILILHSLQSAEVWESSMVRAAEYSFLSKESSRAYPSPQSVAHRLSAYLLYMVQRGREDGRARRSSNSTASYGETLSRSHVSI